MTLEVDCLVGISWMVYSFNVRERDASADLCLFRYDSFPHHEELPSYPHHKHIPRGGVDHVIASGPPSLEQVLGEVLAVSQQRIRR